jgi:hypothetical protein
VGLRATVNTLQIEYPHAQDLSLVLERQAPHPTGKGSGVTTCSTAPDPPLGVRGPWHHHMPPVPPPGRKGLCCHHVSHSSKAASQCRRLWCCHVPPGPLHVREGHRCHHVSHGSRPASWCGRALVSPHATGPAAR